MKTSYAILTAAGLATIGWIYTARRSRHLARKQYTITVLLQGAFNSEYRKALDLLAPHIKEKTCPNLYDDKNSEINDAFRLVANYYEFIAAGLRNGDFDERLVLDSRRATVLSLFEVFQDHIWGMRNSRRRQTIYEHLEWLHGRWEKKPPGKFQRTIERVLARPFAGKRTDPHG